MMLVFAWEPLFCMALWDGDVPLLWREIATINTTVDVAALFGGPGESHLYLIAYLG